MQIDELTVGAPTRNKARNILAFLPFCPPQLYLIVVDASPDSTLEMVEVHRPERPLVVRRPGTVTEATKTPVTGLTG